MSISKHCMLGKCMIRCEAVWDRWSIEQCAYLSSILGSLTLLSWWPSGPGTIVLLLDAVPVIWQRQKKCLFSNKFTIKTKAGNNTVWMYCVMLTGDRGDFVGGGDTVIRWVIHVGYSWAHRVSQLQLGHQLLQKLHSFVSSQVDHNTLYLEKTKYVKTTFISFSDRSDMTLHHMFHTIKTIHATVRTCMIGQKRWHSHKSGDLAHCWLQICWWGSVGWSWDSWASYLPEWSIHSQSLTMQTHLHTIRTHKNTHIIHIHDPTYYFQ